jgi:hypothetical protein
MRWKLLRRRLSVSAPRMIVRSHLPWPLRWAVGAVALGFSAALALWAFEFGKEIAGLDRGAKEELASLRTELQDLRVKYDEVRNVSNTADSMLKTERAAQERLGQQLRQLEQEKQALQADLGFFQRLLPTGSEGLQLRGLQAEVKVPGQLRYQMLVVQPAAAKGEEFSGRYEVLLSGQLDAKTWSMPLPGGPRNLQVKQVARVEGTVDHPANAVIKTVQVRIMDAKGATRASYTTKL